MAYHRGNLLSHPFFICSYTCASPLLSFTILLLLRHQVAQLTYVIDERLKEATEDTEQERALKDVAVTTVEERGKAAEDFEKRA